MDEQGEFIDSNRLTDSNRYRNTFPGIHFRYDRGHFSYTGSWSNTVWRPWYGMVVPFRFVNQRDEFVDQGNPDLRPTLTENYNAAVDYKISDSTTLSLELKYVDVEDSLFYEITRVETGPFSGYRLGTNKNGPSSEFSSVRILWNQSLGDIFQPLHLVHFNLDYTYTHTETEYPSRPRITMPLQKYPDHRTQFNLRYASKKIFAQLQCSYQVEQLGNIDKEVWRDRYDFDKVWMNFTGSYSMTRKVRAFVNVHNVLNVPAHRSYIGSESRPADYNWDPRRFNVGFRLEL